MDRRSMAFVFVLFLIFVYFFSPYARNWTDDKIQDVEHFLWGLDSISIEEVNSNPENYLNETVTIQGFPNWDTPTGQREALYSRKGISNYLSEDGEKIHHNCDIEMIEDFARINGTLKSIDICNCMVYETSWSDDAIGYKEVFECEDYYLDSNFYDDSKCKENSREIVYYIDCDNIIKPS